MTELPTENVRDYPRPPAIEWVDWPITVDLGGMRIVDVSGAWRVLETFHPPTYYVAEADMAEGALVPITGRRSLCEWKGQAHYYDVSGGGRTAPAAAWGYRDPTPRFHDLRGHVAIYAEPMDRVTVAGIAVVPQPGNFYGGWATPNITGPIKGAPGTTHW